jgi:hypothetical protein
MRMVDHLIEDFRAGRVSAHVLADLFLLSRSGYSLANLVRKLGDRRTFSVADLAAVAEFDCEAVTVADYLEEFQRLGVVTPASDGLYALPA